MDEKTIFLAALEIDDPGRRRVYLDEACRGRPELRRGVERLLVARPSGEDFLESPPSEVAAVAKELSQGGAAAADLSFLTPATQPDALGRLGHYEILELVGSGGCGVVLRAFDEKLRRVVAIKALATALAASATARKRFVREAQAAAAVNHDNVVHIYAVEEAGPVPYLVMEFVAGMSLEERLRREGPLELKEVLRIGLQAAEGLAAAHRQGLVHRDVKPANILLENGVQRVRITDFGLARAADDASLTQAGMIAGTPMYMSPEQARGAAVDHRSDLFSLGSVLYAMASGQPPFKASSSLAALRRVCEETPPLLGELNRELPAWLIALVERLLAKDPAARYQTADEVVERLSQGLAQIQQPGLAVQSEPPPAKPATLALRKPPARRGWWWTVAAALAVIASSFGLAEGTGVSHVTAAVVRVLTPRGTLVVEVNEPGVSVTVEGDGEELVISGAGLHELRLRPGQHRVVATKDGLPATVDRPLVSIEQGGKQQVKVTWEQPTLPPRPVVAQPSDLKTADAPKPPRLSLAPDQAAETVAELTRRLSESPADMVMLLVRGRANRVLERYDEAIADFTQIVDFQPQPIQYTAALHCRAESHELKGDLPAAIEDWNAALRLEPWNLVVQAQLADDYLFLPPDQRRTEDALTLINAVIVARGRDPLRGLLTRALVYYRLDRFDEATTDLVAEQRLAGAVTPGHLLVSALCLQKRGEAAAARRDYVSANAVWPDLARVAAHEKFKLLRLRAEVEDLLKIRPVNSPANLPPRPPPVRPATPEP